VVFCIAALWIHRQPSHSARMCVFVCVPLFFGDFSGSGQMLLYKISSCFLETINKVLFLMTPQILFVPGIH
jgi:hypothetical protein